MSGFSVARTDLPPMRQFDKVMSVTVASGCKPTHLEEIISAIWKNRAVRSMRAVPGASDTSVHRHGQGVPIPLNKKQTACRNVKSLYSLRIMVQEVNKGSINYVFCS